MIKKGLYLIALALVLFTSGLLKVGAITCDVTIQDNSNKIFNGHKVQINFDDGNFTFINMPVYTCEVVGGNIVCNKDSEGDYTADPVYNSLRLNQEWFEHNVCPEIKITVNTITPGRGTAGYLLYRITFEIEAFKPPDGCYGSSVQCYGNNDNWRFKYSCGANEPFTSVKNPTGYLSPNFDKIRLYDKFHIIEDGQIVNLICPTLHVATAVLPGPLGNRKYLVFSFEPLTNEDVPGIITDDSEEVTPDIGDRFIAPVYSAPIPIDCSDFEDDEGNIIATIYSIIMIMAPILVILFGSLDFARATFSADAEAIRKSQLNFLKRIIAAIILFLLPSIIRIMFYLAINAGIKISEPIFCIFG